MSAVPHLAPVDMATLQSLEEELWLEETRFDVIRMRQIIADDFFEYGRSGRVYTRDDTLAIERQPIHAKLPLPNFQARLISAEVAQVTYNTEVSHNGVIQQARRSSIWSKSTRGWQLRFHQGTPFNAVA